MSNRSAARVAGQAIKRGRPFKRRHLRGTTLDKTLIAALEEMTALPSSEAPITVTSVAERAGIGRSTIYKRGLEHKIHEYAERQRVNFGARATGASDRHNGWTKRQIKELKERVRQLDCQLEAERAAFARTWRDVAQNALAIGVRVEELFAECSPPPMGAPATGGRRRRRAK